MQSSASTIAERISRLRTIRNWTKAELARRAQLNAADVSRIELQRSSPYPGQVRKLAEAFGVTVAELTGDDDA